MCRGCHCTLQHFWCNINAISLQGDPGDLFYVIKEGEASVYQV